jgi:hypothetical protein
VRGSICKSECSQLTERIDYIVKAKCIKERRFGENSKNTPGKRKYRTSGCYVREKQDETSKLLVQEINRPYHFYFLFV